MLKTFEKAAEWLIGQSADKKIKVSDVQKGYADQRPSIADYWGIADFCDENQIFLLADGQSIGSGFELESLPCEAASDDYLETVFDKIRDTFANAVPCHKKDPWVMQVYVQDEYNLNPVLEHVRQSIPEQILQSEFTQDYLQRLGGLFSKMTRPQGIFTDPKTDSPYRGRRRRIRLLFYRRYQESSVSREKAYDEHMEVIAHLENRLKTPGLKLKRLTGRSYYYWWMNWFNPNTSSSSELLKKYPYPGDNKSAAFQFNHSVFFSAPESNENGFSIDGWQYRTLYVDGLREAPPAGVLSRERQQANPRHRYALLDKLPEGAVYVMQVTFSSDEVLDMHLSRLEKGVVGTSLKPTEVRNDIKAARDALSAGNRLFWVNQAVIYRGSTEQDCQLQEKQLHSLFAEAKMPLLDSKYDLHPINSLINLLPFNYVPGFARQYLKYDRLIFASELAALLPVYGRNQGAKNLPCLTFFNRLGEPVFFDVLHRDFISQNSHMALFANSGGGKSVATGWMINSLMATKNARIVLFEMGNSFDRILMHAKAKGKKTKQLLLSAKRGEAVPLNPFCEAYKALPEICEQLNETQAEKLAAKMHDMSSGHGHYASDEEKACDDDSRSYLSELALALRTMITEANALEESQFTLADETLVIEVLCDAITTSFQNDVPQMLTEHVVQAFDRRIKTESVPRKKERLLDMHDRLKSYVINSAKARFFNVPTEPLGDFDIFHVDISAIKDEHGKLALVMVSLLPRILAMAEATQNDDRPTFLFIDESHIQFQIPSVVSCCLMVAKVARKLGLWLVAVTQSVSDMNSDKATKILSLIETWILLGLDEKELANVKQYKELTEQQEDLIRDIDSQKSLYAEAVLLGSRYQGLFRVIPPRYLLALLMTEKSEKAERSTLEQQHDVLKAAEILAENLENQPHNPSEEACFFGD